MKILNKIFFNLQAKNYKAAYLSILRVLICIFLLKEILFKYSAWELLYSNSSTLQFNTHSAFLVSGLNVAWCKAHYVLIITSYCIFLLLFLIGFGKKFVACCCLLLLFLLQKINNVEVNGGDVMARFILLCLCFANSFEYLCIKPYKHSTATNNVISNLATMSIMLQLCVAYFVAAVHKINNPFWQDGTAMFYVLNTEAYISGSFAQSLAKQTWLVYFTTYFTLFIELLFPIFIWHKKTRKSFLLMGLLLHIGIYLLMMLYNLQFAFLCIYGLFLSNKFWINILNKRKLKVQ